MSACGGRLPSLVFIIIAALTSGPARAENLDAGKSGATLFTATCAGCHRSPRGLAKNRFSLTLSFFLQQHYTSSAASAQVLTAYLQSVEAPRGKPQPAAPPGRRAWAPSVRCRRQCRSAPAGTHKVPTRVTRGSPVRLGSEPRAISA